MSTTDRTTPTAEQVLDELHRIARAERRKASDDLLKRLYADAEAARRKKNAEAPRNGDTDPPTSPR